jgi:radical SAM superfamily enzyme YgiQ (UPF0313 family)
VRALLVSTYDMGRQPFGLASPAAWLREAGVDVSCADLSRESLSDDAIGAAGVIAFFLPMHTATRLALPVIDKVRSVNPSAVLCAYGLYAPLNAAMLRQHGVTTILGGEFEEDLVSLVVRGKSGQAAEPDPDRLGARRLPRLAFRVPDRAGLPGLSRYATLQIGAERRTVGYTEASRGCKHRCRHCPIVPVYDGRFRVVPVDVVVADIRAQVEAGARHVTFGDPDFFNGIGHATAVVEALGREFAGVSYDVTIKIEHLLQHQHALPLLRRTGCAFVTSAVEALDDDVLAKLEKGHTRADFERIVGTFREIDLVLAPTFVAFTHWTTLESYLDFLETIDRLALVDQVASIQLAIRLLVTQGSRLLELDDVQRGLGRFDPRSLCYQWRHPDARVDRLQQQIERLVGTRLSAPRHEVFGRVWQLAHEAVDRVPPPRVEGALPRAAVPYLNEPWYC